MKKRELEKLAQTVEDMPVSNFYMGVWAYAPNRMNEVLPEDLHMCGTTCCIAGTYQLSKGRSVVATGGTTFVVDEDGNSLGEIEHLTAKELGLTLIQARRLFHFPSWPGRFLCNTNPSPDDAAKRIRHMIATGK